MRVDALFHALWDNTEAEGPGGVAPPAAGGDRRAERVIVLLVGLYGVAAGLAFGAQGLTALLDKAESTAAARDPDLVADDLFSGADRVLYAPHQASGWITTKVLAPLACRHGYPLVSEAREGHDPAARLRQDRL